MLGCEGCYYYKFKLVESKTGLPKGVRPVCLAFAQTLANGDVYFSKEATEMCGNYITLEGLIALFQVGK